jgi:hypothetical protein
MLDFYLPIHPVVMARVALLRAGGMQWAEIAGKLNLTVTETEAMPNRPEWDALHKLAVRAAAKEAEAEARLELRRGLRSSDEEEVMAAAEEVYRRQMHRPARRKSGKPAPPSSENQLVENYLECLNNMSVAEFLALEAKQRTAQPAPPPGPIVTPE